MKTLRICFLCLAFFCLAGLLHAEGFTSVAWRKDTTALGMSFPGAVYESGSLLPQYVAELNMGRDYDGKQYVVSVDYPEYQTVGIPSGLAEAVRELPSEPLARTSMAVLSHEGILQIRLVPLIYREGKLMRINSFRLTVKEGTVRQTARSVSLRAAAPRKGTYAASSVLAEGRWVKISVPHTGVFKLTHESLRSMGFKDPAKVRLYGYGGALLPEDLKNLPPDDLCEVPLWRESGYVLFYGKGPVSWALARNKSYFVRHQNFYARVGYYFLTEGQEEAAAFPQGEKYAELPQDTVDTFNDYALYEVDGYNWAGSGRELYDSYDFATGNTRSYRFSMPGVRNEGAYCTIDFSAKHTAATTVEVAIDGSRAGSLSISGLNTSSAYYNYYKASTASSTFAVSGLKEQSVLTLTHERPSGVPGRLNYLALNYHRDLALYGGHTVFRDISALGKSSVLYRLSGASSSTVVWDVTSHGSYFQVPASLSGSLLSFTADHRELHEYVAVDPRGNFDAPTVIGVVPNQDIHGLEQPDMVIVVPSSAKWKESAELLAEAHRQEDGMTVHVLTAAQVYNEFSSGTPDATAYRRMMKMFYDRASDGSLKSPSYLLMMGDCAYDNRMISMQWQDYDPNDFLLCYQSRNSVSEINSYVTDDYLGMLDEGEGVNLRADKMDIGVGRFPVRTAQEAAEMVQKTVAYIRNEQTGSWKNRICYAADDEENRLTNVFMTAAEGYATHIEKNYPNFVVTRLYQDAFKRETTASGHRYSQATKRLLSLVDEGLLLLNYTGHGSSRNWSAENLLTIDQIRAMRNARQGLWVTATCDFCRYDNTDNSAGEEAFLNPNGGAIALFTTSRTVFSPNNEILNEALNRHVFDSAEDGTPLRLGDVMRLAKNESILLNDSNKLSFALIGDPALKLTYPDSRIVLDSFNGEAASSSDLWMKAGDLITVEGHIETAQKTLDADFTGVISPIVYDAIEHVVCYNNAHSGTDLEAFEFDQRNSRLFVGSDSVRNGRFSITFPVPLDISYSNKSGLINLYAVSTDTVETAGTFSNFLVGGTADDGLQTDSLGPAIDLWLNSAQADPSRPVGPNPVLYASISDEEGINSSGNGIGHDIVVSVDNDPQYTYNLNEYFQTLPGNYRKGTLVYQFESLPDGDHTLYLTAWDTKNNSSTVRYPFSVSSSEAPAVSQLSCYPMPAVEEITFCFTHDRPSSQMTLTFEVFDLMGRPLWQKTLTDHTSGTYFTYTWDLTTSGGARLPQGVYLYRVHVSADGSNETSEVLKFIVAAQ